MALCRNLKVHRLFVPTCGPPTVIPNRLKQRFAERNSKFRQSQAHSTPTKTPKPCSVRGPVPRRGLRKIRPQCVVLVAGNAQNNETQHGCARVHACAHMPHNLQCPHSTSAGHLPQLGAHLHQPGGRRQREEGMVRLERTASDKLGVEPHGHTEPCTQGPGPVLRAVHQCSRSSRRLPVTVTALSLLPALCVVPHRPCSAL